MSTGGTRLLSYWQFWNRNGNMKLHKRMWPLCHQDRYPVGYYQCESTRDSRNCREWGCKLVRAAQNKIGELTSDSSAFAVVTVKKVGCKATFDDWSWPRICCSKSLGSTISWPRLCERPQMDRFGMLITGCWFGTSFIFPYIGNHDPNWRTHIFQRGRYTTNRYNYGTIMRWLFLRYPPVEDQTWLAGQPTI